MHSKSIPESSPDARVRCGLNVDPACNPDTIAVPPVPATRKRGKCMSRRKGQNPKVRVGKRADGTKYYFFQYWLDVAGREERRRETEVI